MALRVVLRGHSCIAGLCFVSMYIPRCVMVASGQTAVFGVNVTRLGN